MDLDAEQRLTAKGRATRERIVLTAGELIVAEGLVAFNMDNVRKAAAVSGSQLAHYFTDKRALLHAVIDRQIEVVLDFHRQPKLGQLDTFDDFERWIDLNMRYLRRIEYTGTPTYHALAAQLAKSDDATRGSLATGYWRWIDLIEQAIGRMKDAKALTARAEPRALAMAVVSAHQGGATLAFTYRAEWPHADATRFAVNWLRAFATDPAERTPRPPREPRAPQESARSEGDDTGSRLTRKGLATRARIVAAAADLMFERGVANASIEDVRSSAGVSGSQITHYFRDKRALTRQVIATRRNDVRTFHTRQQFGTLDSLDAVAAWADACLNDVDTVYRRGGCVYGSLAGELIDADDEIHRDLSAGYDEWIELFRTGLVAMRRRGELRADADPRHLAVSLVAAHQGGAMVTHATGDAGPIAATLRAAVGYVRSFAAID
ncbi:TetR/AcrR family transcriptional regulator [Mycobacterium vicinigordonae]|uniref:TetR/AcrR family transcriptional regulator n=1 Tax=Mycobacterium vicinigordonae TaxID=1719132 RepID=A0A7D6E0E4_9MYCO|nr:TetR/AcrR family transcriptional regulator [Mycobacterium vicinigordonae]QLL06901.1 TetR/AcrR family transcriptional regulator [Mycobacterium vicinigordonae]